MKKYGKLIILETLKEIVNPGHTALVLWDSQNAMVNNIFNRDEYLSNIKNLLVAARQQKIPVIYTKSTPIHAGYQSAWSFYLSMKRFNLDDPSKIPVFIKQNGPESELNEIIAPSVEDLVLNKQSQNIFFGTNFEQLMRFRGIQSILFAGIATEYGIEHSAREASIRGFYTLVVSDCVSSPDRITHEMALKILPHLCLVLPSKDIISEWKE